MPYHTPEDTARNLGLGLDPEYLRTRGTVDLGDEPEMVTDNSALGGGMLGLGGTFEGYLQDFPKRTYFSYQDEPGGGFGRSPNQRRYYQKSFDRIYNQFLGTLGTAARQGITPNQPGAQWTDFLEAFPFTERYASLPPQLRGTSSSRFAPFTRFVA